jgi:hypothetical protein
LRFLELFVGYFINQPLRICVGELWVGFDRHQIRKLDIVGVSGVASEYEQLKYLLQ